VKDLGKDPKKVLDYSQEGLFCFVASLADGRVVNIVLYESTQDGYFLLTCPAALKSLVPFDALEWAKACSLYELLFDFPDNSVRDGYYYGMATLRIKPQSAKELRLELEWFMARIEAAVEHFNQRRSATSSGTVPD